MTNELTQLRSLYRQAANRMVGLLPTLLSMIDFQKTGDFNLVAQRMQEGYYGTVVNNKFVAPKTGPYVGFLQDIDPANLKNFQEVIDGAEN